MGRIAALRRSFVSWSGVLGAGVVLSSLAIERPSYALLEVGAEGGLIKRTADTPNNLDVGVGYGVHGEFNLVPLVKFGPYYLHYELSQADDAPRAADATFNTLGLRGRLTLPVPGSVAPYAFVGAGYTWARYAEPTGDAKGHFFEIPVGAGVAWRVAEILSLSLEGAYRPGVGFGGGAFDTLGLSHPTSGWSLLLGASFEL